MTTPLGFPPPAPITTVIFDLHTTLVDQGDTARWLQDAAARIGRAPGPEVVADLVPALDVLWDRARDVDPDSHRDFSAEGHRQVFDTLIGEIAGVDQALADALYAAVSDEWRAYTDAVPVLTELRRRSVSVVVLSNTGIDIRPVLDREGLAPLVDAVILSMEVGAVKPDPAIFEAALAAVDAVAGQTLMVGDSAGHDAGGVALGIRTLLLPRTSGQTHGLHTVLGVVDASHADDRWAGSPTGSPVG